jgi:hypothetical protein
VVDLSGEYTNERGDWVLRDKNRQWVPSRINPTEEALVDVKALKTFLSSHNLAEVPVFGVVVFTHEEPVARISTHEPILPVGHLSNLIQQLQNNYLAEDRINPAQIKRIVELIYDN